MNKDKAGEMFHYHDTFLSLREYVKVYFHLPYRQIKGITKGLAHGKVSSIPDCTIINRRIKRSNIQTNDGYNSSKEFKDDSIMIATDSTKIKA